MHIKAGFCECFTWNKPPKSQSVESITSHEGNNSALPYSKEPKI